MNDSHEDDEGWDLFVQFPGSNEPALFLDRSPPERSCLVQVKATRDPQGRAQMSLSNALKLARYPGPAFAAICYFQGDTLTRVWLAHCDASFVERVLGESLARMEKSVHSHNRVWLSLSPRATDHVADDPQQFRSLLGDSIGTDMYGYIGQKQNWLRDAGYSGARAHVELHFGKMQTSEHFQQLAELAIGLRSELPLASADMYDVRFGKRRLERTLSDASLQFPAVDTGPRTNVTIEGENGDSVELVCRTRVASAVFPFLPPQYDKIRLESEHLDFLAEKDPTSPTTLRTRWILKAPPERVSAAELQTRAAAAKAIRWLMNGEARVTTRFGDRAQTLPVDGPWQPSDADVARRLKALEALATVVRVLGLDIGTRNIPEDALAEQAEMLHLLAAALDGKSIDLAISFPKSESPGGLDVGETCALLWPLHLKFADKSICVIIGIAGTIAQRGEDPERREIRAQRLLKLAQHVGPKGTEPPLEKLTDVAERSVASFGIRHVFQLSDYLPPPVGKAITE